MPEGDTIHKLAGYLHPCLAGRVVDRGLAIARQRGRRFDLDGRRVREVAARGKHLYIIFEGGVSLRSHLGMHGSWHRYRADEPWQRPAHRASIQLQAGDQVYVCFNAKEVELVRDGSIRARHLDSRLGPDLVDPDVELDRVIGRVRAILQPEMSLADVLLDQRVAAGIGNVYKSECLYLCGLHPLGLLQEVDDGRLRAVYERARDLLLRNLGGGSRVTRFVEDGRGRLWVYGRAGRECFGCGGRIEYARTGRGWRATFWCPNCQPRGRS